MVSLETIFCVGFSSYMKRTNLPINLPTDESPYWEKNRNFFDFLSHGVEIRFSNFRLGQFAKVLAIPSQNGTSDEIDNSTPSGDNSTPSGAT